MVNVKYCEVNAYAERSFKGNSGGVGICRERDDRVLLCGHANLYLEGEIFI